MDREADFTAFVGARGAALRRMAYLMTGDWDEAQDIVQTSLAKLYVAWPRVDAAGAESYARRIIANVFVDGRRRSWGREHPTFPTPQADHPDTPGALTPTSGKSRRGPWPELADFYLFGGGENRIPRLVPPTSTKLAADVERLTAAQGSKDWTIDSDSPLPGDMAGHSWTSTDGLLQVQVSGAGVLGDYCKGYLQAEPESTCNESRQDGFDVFTSHSPKGGTKTGRIVYSVTVRRADGANVLVTSDGAPLTLEQTQALALALAPSTSSGWRRGRRSTVSIVVAGWRNTSRPTVSPSQELGVTNASCALSRRSDQSL